MMKFKRYFALLLAAACLSLAACGGQQEEYIAGDDWRTTGVVVADGTITHDGESVDVLVTVGESSAAFYWDDSVQVLYDSVSFPMNVPDAQQAFNAISFEDIDGDGESDVLVSFIHENGDADELIWIWDPEERYVFREDLSTITIGGGDLEDYVGLWEYQGENLWLRIHDDATWELINDQEDVIEYGTLWVEENGITLHFDGSGDVLTLDRTVSGDLIDMANDGMLMPAEGIQSSAEYFERNGLEINADMDMGTYLLTDGVCSYNYLGEEYRTGDCYWEVIKTYDVTHDGIREIQFDAICYIADGEITDADRLAVVSGELYDAWTGMWFTTDTTYDNSDRGENYYLHTVSWEGNSYQIEFGYSTQWRYDVGDWAMTLTKSYVVYLPEDYDGLVFAAAAEPDNYPDCAKRMQMDNIAPEAAILEIETLDPYSSLYFGICD